MNQRDKMPLEVTPVYFKLQRYTVANTTLPASVPANQPNQPAADPNGNAPSATPGTSNTNQTTQPQSAAQPADGSVAAQQQSPVTVPNQR